MQRSPMWVNAKGKKYRKGRRIARIKISLNAAWLKNKNLNVSIM